MPVEFRVALTYNICIEKLAFGRSSAEKERSGSMELHPLLWVLIFAVGMFLMVLLCSFLVAVCVAAAGRRYGDKLQKKHQQKIRDMLPGRDCGQCGCENCDGFARAVLFGAVAENACPYGQEDLPERMLQVVADMQKLMEDPKPPKARKDRMETLWETKF